MLSERIGRELPYLPREEARALVGIVQRLVEAYRAERVYRFGSKARGDDGPDSDFDVMVVVPDDASEDRKRRNLAYERLWGTGTAADALVWTRALREPHVPTRIAARHHLAGRKTSICALTEVVRLA